MLYMKENKFTKIVLSHKYLIIGMSSARSRYERSVPDVGSGMRPKLSEHSGGGFFRFAFFGGKESEQGHKDAIGDAAVQGEMTVTEAPKGIPAVADDSTADLPKFDLNSSLAK